jgi:hypothetical protein
LAALCAETEEKVMKSQLLCKTIGVAVLSFGVGVLVSFFLPDKVLVVIEALLIVAIGTLFFLGQRRA